MQTSDHEMLLCTYGIGGGKGWGGAQWETGMGTGARSRWFVEGKLVIPCLWMACYEHIYILTVKALYWLPHL